MLITFAGVAVQIGGMFAAVAADHQQRGAVPSNIHDAVVFLIFLESTKY